MFLPNEKRIKKYAEIITKHFENKRFRCNQKIGDQIDVAGGEIRFTWTKEILPAKGFTTHRHQCPFLRLSERLGFGRRCFRERSPETDSAESAAAAKINDVRQFRFISSLSEFSH